ncbi:MAG: Hsp33 family molecular chaperone HslO [Myxococcota bacterium]
MSEQYDRALRAISNEGDFRVITLRTTETVQKAIDAQELEGAAAERFAEVLTGAVLVRETMAPRHRVQVTLKGSDGASLMADSHPDGLTRGLASVEDTRGVELGEGALLKVTRAMPRSKLHEGVVSAETDKGFSGALMQYFQASEQVTSMVSVSCVMEGGRVRAAGGYIVQLLPELTKVPLMIMTERLEDFRNIDGVLARTDADPEHMLDEILFGFPHKRLDERPVRFDCTCSAPRLLAALASMGRAEIEDIVREGKPLDVGCDYCGLRYEVGVEQLRTLLEEH